MIPEEPEFTGNKLPPFPVDDQTLDMLWDAIHPGPGATRSSVTDFLDLMTRLGGSDPDAIQDTILENVHVMRDQFYHEHDVMSALIEEIRRLRARA